MCTEKGDSMIKETLKNICCSNEWCYGIFWGFDQRNSLFLTLKDAYYEEQMGDLIDNMLLQVHVLGGGLIGQAAFIQNHRWMFADSHHQRENSLGSFESLEDFLDSDHKFYGQFSVGIKTIAIISVEPWGVVQLGSTQKIHERKDFVDQVKQLFRGIYEGQIINISENANHSSQSFPSTSDHEKTNLPFFDSKIIDQLDPLVFFESGYFFDSSGTQTLSANSECSTVTSSWPQLTSEFIQENATFSKDSLITQNDFSLLEQRPSSLLSLDELFQENDFSYDLSDSWCFSPLPDSNGLVPLPNNISENLETNSILSSVSNAYGTNHEDKKRKGWNETLIPFVSCDDPLKFGSDDISSIIGTTQNSLFSKLGLDHLLDGSASSFSKSRNDDQTSSASNRRKNENYSWSQNQVKIQDLDGQIKSKNRVYEEQSSCIGNMSKKEELRAKGGKKKGKMGTKPRPKDRQMIQDRLAELRELIPHGEKMSIDRLLERTIRHMNFMQSLTKHAETLRQIEKTKSWTAQNDNSISGDGGVTWACEVGDQTMACPLMVVDLNTPGQMLIEILCEDQGFFLEIVDIIRGFGLIIMKGVMEVRETKIWAHFIVEAEGNRCVTRHKIFSSLIQHLQMSGQSSNDHFGNVVRSDASLFNDFQSSISFPVTLRCTSL